MTFRPDLPKSHVNVLLEAQSPDEQNPLPPRQALEEKYCCGFPAGI
jgi:hypothetical protein